MNIVLISLDQEIFTLGIRILSSCLRSSGYSTRCIFLPPSNSSNLTVGKFERTYSKSLIDDLTEICSDSKLVGISLLSNQYNQAVQITHALKSSGIQIPVIWGGIEPTVEPEECLKHADLVCIGEGEDALLDLVKSLDEGRPYNSIPNLWIRDGNETIVNPIRPLRQDLNSLPFPDYDCIEHYIAREEHILPLTSTDLTDFRGERYRHDSDGIMYPMMTSRGCPYACTYCCNSVYERLYNRQRRLRWRSIDQIVQEITYIQRVVAPIRQVLFVDDNFSARSIKELDLFCKRFKAEVGLPFHCQISPLTINEEKLEILLDAGCIKFIMGVETANEHVANLYNRRHAHKATQKAVDLINKYRTRMELPPTFQFIIDNPYETLDETIETLRYAISLPRPWDNPIYSLMLFPGTPLFEKALQDGIITDKNSQVYSRNWLDQSQPYLQFWIRLYRANFHPLLLSWMMNPWLMKLLTSTSARKLWSTRVFRWLWDTRKSDSFINRMFKMYSSKLLGSR